MRLMTGGKLIVSKKAKPRRPNRNIIHHEHIFRIIHHYHIFHFLYNSHYEHYSQFFNIIHDHEHISHIFQFFIFFYIFIIIMQSNGFKYIINRPHCFLK